VLALEDLSSDKRLKILDATLKRLQFQQDALIEVLHKAQDLFGFLGRDVLWYVARALKLPPSRVYGVATFYHRFTLKPQGEHTCVVCLGTACFVKGADHVLNTVQECFHIRVGQTTPDKKVSLLTVRCVGACSIAPVVILDGKTSGRQTPAMLLQQVKGWLPDGSH